MASRAFIGQSELPQFTDGESTEEKLEKLTDYIYLLNEQYRYVLCQLNSENE